MGLDCPDCGAENVSSYRTSTTHFASRYTCQCHNCGHEWRRTEWS